ncbi:MAG: FtsX-like permease family protein [Culicoidibacterales bacterium]
MRIYFSFLKRYYVQNKMQFLGPIFILIIVCSVLFGTISANKILTEQTEAQFFEQYGSLTQIIQSKEKKGVEEKRFLEDVDSDTQTLYLQNNVVYEKDAEVIFVNFYGIGETFFNMFPINEVYPLEDDSIVISASFAEKQGIKIGETVEIKAYGHSFKYTVKALAEGDFFAKEDTKGANFLINKVRYRKDFDLDENLVNVFAGTNAKVVKSEADYEVNNIRNNMIVIGQLQVIQLVVTIINAIIIFVTMYILYGFYRMSFSGKVQYFSTLNIIGVTKKKLIKLMWAENILIMTSIFAIVSLISFLISPLQLSQYATIYALLIATIITTNIFIARLFLKMNALMQVLGREITVLKNGLVAFIIITIISIVACIFSPNILTFILAGLNIMFGIFWTLFDTQKSNVQLIKQLNKERIVNEMKVILSLSLISLLTISSAVLGIQTFVTNIYNNWDFEQQITIDKEKEKEITAYLDDKEIIQESFVWKNYPLAPLDFKYGTEEKGMITDVLAIDNIEDLEWFNIEKDAINFNALLELNAIYLDSEYEKYNLDSTIEIDGEIFKIKGYFNSSMSATNHVAILSRDNYSKINDDKIIQIYLKDSGNVLNDLYGEFGNSILGVLDAGEQRSANLLFVQSLEGILIFFIFFIMVICILSLLNSFFILRDKQRRVFATLGSSGLSKKMLFNLNVWQLITIGIQALLVSELLLVLVLEFFDWFVAMSIGQSILFLTTMMMQQQAIGIYVVALLVVLIANYFDLKKMNILKTVQKG